MMETADGHPNPEARRDEDRQRRVDELLRWGMVFSIFWLLGIGSIIAVVSGLKARRLIRDSGYALAGMRRVWWCLVIGGLGIVLWIPIVVIGIANNL